MFETLEATCRQREQAASPALRLMIVSAAASVMIAHATSAQAGDRCVPHADTTLAQFGDETVQAVMLFAVHEFNGELVAAGAWTPDPSGQDPPTHTILDRWDATSESWQALGDTEEGLSHYAFAEYDGELIVAGGSFEDPSVGFVLRWDGSDWHPLGEEDTFNGEVFRLLLHEGNLIATGGFNSVGGEPGHIAKWDGTSWQPIAGDFGSSHLGPDAITVYNGDLVVGGQFTSIDGMSVNRVARWDGEQWHALGDGIEAVGGVAAVMTLGVYNGDLIAGGMFFTPTFEPMSVARWDGTQWHPIGTGIDFMVTSLTEYDGKLIAGGMFLQAGGTLVNGIAQWDGSGDWQGVGPDGACPGLAKLGCGLQGDPFDPIVPLLVWDMLDYNGRLVIAGSFQGGFGESALSIITWDGCVATPSNPADLDGDGFVNVFDLLDLLAQWGTCVDCRDCPADLTSDCDVNVFDLLELLAQWGPA